MSPEIFRLSPFKLFITSVIIIFIAEAVVMLCLPNIHELNRLQIALIDAALLSLIVCPTLYLLFFKPMKRSIDSLEASEEYQEQLRKIDKIKNDFITIAAHELCTPVSAIMGYTELLLEEEPTEKQNEYLGVVYDKSLTLERIIDDLLMLHRFESGNTLEVQKVEYDLVQTIQNVVDYYRVKSPDQPIHLNLPKEGLLFYYDPIRITQVLDNLLSNAIKYSNDLHDRIDLTLTEKPGEVILVLRDEGIGMTRKELQQIYKKFFRAETEKSMVGGLGLGMAIVKIIVESHGGSIDIISQRGVGTTVTIRLPKASSQPA